MEELSISSISRGDPLKQHGTPGLFEKFRPSIFSTRSQFEKINHPVALAGSPQQKLLSRIVTRSKVVQKSEDIFCRISTNSWSKLSTSDDSRIKGVLPAPFSQIAIHDSRTRKARMGTITFGFRAIIGAQKIGITDKGLSSPP